MSDRRCPGGNDHEAQDIGRVKLVRSSDEGREQVLHQEGPGATLAEVPVFDGDGYVGSTTFRSGSPRRRLLRLSQKRSATFSRHP